MIQGVMKSKPTNTNYGLKKITIIFIYDYKETIMANKEMYLYTHLIHLYINIYTCTPIAAAVPCLEISFESG